jgi:hypothetical protein
LNQENQGHQVIRQQKIKLMLGLSVCNGLFPKGRLVAQSFFICLQLLVVQALPIS